MRQKRDGVFFTWALFVGLFFVSAVCAAQEVRTNYTPGTDFAKYRTYRWVSIEGGAHPNQIIDEEIRQSVDAQLSSKGLTKTDGEADLLVGYQVAVDKEKQWNAYGMGGGWRLGGGMATATSSTIDVGTLVLDMYDSTKKQLVWTGRATNTIDPSKSPEKNQERMEKAMAKLLKDFPPKEK